MKHELLAPAGDLEKLKIALIYGADAVYIGGLNFSLRARASNFTIEDIKEACKFAHDLNKKVYVTTNIIPHNEDLNDLIEYLKQLEEAKVDAIIVASLYIMQVALKYTKLEVHISTQESTMNNEMIELFYKLGAKRVVLARELTKEEIKDIINYSKLDIEVFIHGGMCASYSGRCVLSNNMTNRDANRGGCAHSCRWNYDLYHNNIKINENLPYFTMSQRDLKAIYEIPELIKMNVSSFKIEGRMKSLYYIATVVKTYRTLIDDTLTNKLKDLSYYDNEIKKAENRFTSSGFLEYDGIERRLYNMRSEIPTKAFLGIVLDYDEKNKIATIEQRNYFEPYQTLEFFGPKLNNTLFTIDKIYDLDNNELDAARHPKQILKIKIPFKVSKYDLIRTKD